MWEKAGVNVSVVYGTMPPDAYRAATSAKLPTNGAVSRGDFTPALGQRLWGPVHGFVAIVRLGVVCVHAFARTRI